MSRPLRMQCLNSAPQTRPFCAIIWLKHFLVRGWEMVIVGNPCCARTDPWVWVPSPHVRVVRRGVHLGKGTVLASQSSQNSKPQVQGETLSQKKLGRIIKHLTLTSGLYMYMHTNTRTHVHTQIHMHAHKHAHTSMHVYVCGHTHTGMHVTHKQIPNH